MVGHKCSQSGVPTCRFFVAGFSDYLNGVQPPVSSIDMAVIYSQILYSAVVILKVRHQE